MPEIQSDLCALGFKVVHDENRGDVMSVSLLYTRIRLIFGFRYTRIYSGQVEVGQSVMNTTKNAGERISRVLRVNADLAREIKSAGKCE